MTYAVDCACGEKLPVEAVDAGGTIICRCGATVAVPALSKLRQLAGQSSYPVSVADKLLAMNQAGELPVELVCARCGIGTRDVLPCVLVCETAYINRPGWIAALALWFISPFAAVSQTNASEQAEVHGRDLTVPTPLRLCVDCVSQVESKKKLILALLQKTPIYRELQQLYPHAELVLEK